MTRNPGPAGYPCVSSPTGRCGSPAHRPLSHRRHAISYSPLCPEFTEDKIKAALDGTFTRFDVITGGVKTSWVGDDYQPTHNVMGTTATCAGVKKAGYKHFSQAEDEMIIGLKAKGLSARHIAIILQRSDDTGINKRYRRLVKTGKCQAVVA